MTIGPLVFNLLPFLKHTILKLGTYTQNLLFILFFFFRRALFLAAFCSNFVLVILLYDVITLLYDVITLLYVVITSLFDVITLLYICCDKFII